MNLDGITSGITKNIDKLGILAGITGVNGFNGITQFINSASQGNIHMPDVPGLVTAYTSSGAFRSGIMAAITGYAIGEFAPSGLKKWGDVLQKAGIGYLEGALIAHVLAFASSADLGSNPAKENFNPNWWRNVVSAPTTETAIAASYQY